jgi:hypothetical protein
MFDKIEIYKRKERIFLVFQACLANGPWKFSSFMSLSFW